MLNSTLCACTRTICAILENFQTPEVRCLSLCCLFVLVLVHRLAPPFMATLPSIHPHTDNPHQTQQGVRVPEVLVPFMGGMTFIPFVREARKDAAAAKAADKKTKKVPPAAAVRVESTLSVVLHCIRGRWGVGPSSMHPSTRALTSSVKPIPFKTKQAKAAAATPAGAGAAAAGAGSEAEKLGAEITAKGEEIRKLKAAKADKAALQVCSWRGVHGRGWFG